MKCEWHEEPWPGEDEPSWWQTTVVDAVMDMVEGNCETVAEGLVENEGDVTAAYYRDQEQILAGAYSIERFHEDRDPPVWTRHRVPRFLTDAQAEEETDANLHVDIGLGVDVCHREAVGSLRMSVGYWEPEEGHRVKRLTFSGDMLEIRTRRFLWQRLRIEQRDIATSTFMLILGQVFEFLLGLAVVGAAIPQFRGGEKMVMVASILSGSVMCIGSVLGILGSLSQSKRMIRLFMTGTYWTMSVLTTMLYIEFDYFSNVENECASNVGDLSGTASASCNEKKVEVVGLLIVAFLSLLMTFYCNYQCYQVTDSISDLNRVRDNLLISRYFQYRNYLIREDLMRLTGTRRMFGESEKNEREVDKFQRSYGMLGTYDDISPAMVVALGLRDYKFTKYRCDNGQDDVRNLNPAQWDSLVHPPWEGPGDPTKFDDPAQGAPQGI